MFKKFSKIFILFLLFSSTAIAEIINEIKVSGNNRVTNETIINFSDLNVGDDATDELLNNSLKELYSTDFFENISLEINEGTLNIIVKELPIIQEIKINGIKASKIIEDLKNQISLKEKNPFNKNKVSNDVNTILNIFKQSGFYFAEIETNIEDNSNKTVNLIFDINRGEKATINKIKFVGDKKFKDRKLFSVITSEEDKFWKFISNDKFLNVERVNLDKRLLKNFYLEKGFYEVIIQDAYSQLVDKNNFILTFNINAGEKFYFGNFDLNLPTDYDEMKFTKLEKIFNNLKDEKYNLNKIEKILKEIENISLLENYEFINANVVETIDKNKVNFTFDILETKNIYVSKINILGNNITSEEFIRNNLYVDEGDPFNKILHAKSINRLKSKGIFKSVSSKIINEDEFKNSIEINIEEKPTGELMAGAGYGTDGSTFSVGIKENNFNGKGIQLEANLGITEDSIKGSVSYTHPNFAYSDRALTSSLESTTSDKLTGYGYKSTLNKVALGTSYEQYENIFFSPKISIASEKIETTSSASDAYKKQEGSYFDTLFGYGLSYDQRNSSYQPTSGYISSWYQTLPLVSDDGSIYNSYSFTKYSELNDDMVISTGFLARAINSYTNDDVRVSKRLYIPSSRLRGFESGKVGPKDGTDFIGGNYITTLNASSTVPYILQTTENADVKIFFDAGNIWGVDYSSAVDDSNTIRSSAGIALELLTPVGPLSFSFAEAISKASTDKTESFRFQLGTTF
jgi:outer membrane protein insertion porin family